MKRGTDGLLKFKQLQRDLGLTRYECKGLLQDLWDFTAANATAGDIGKFSDDEIAHELEWRGEPRELLEALVARRWLDVHSEHRLVVHDWPDHCEDWVHMRLARAVEVFANGTVPKLTKIGKSERETIRAKWCEVWGLDPMDVRRAHGVRTTAAKPGLAKPKPNADTNRAHTVRTDERRSTDPSHIQDELHLAGSVYGRNLAQRILAVTGEPAFMERHYERLFDVMAQHGGFDTFQEAVEWIEKSTDPIQRARKDIGELHSPGAYIQSACERHLSAQGASCPKVPSALFGPRTT